MVERLGKYLQSRHGSKEVEIIAMNKVSVLKICNKEKLIKKAEVIDDVEKYNERIAISISIE